MKQSEPWIVYRGDIGKMYQGHNNNNNINIINNKTITFILGSQYSMFVLLSFLNVFPFIVYYFCLRGLVYYHELSVTVERSTMFTNGGYIRIVKF